MGKKRKFRSVAPVPYVLGHGSESGLDPPARLKWKSPRSLGKGSDRPEGRLNGRPLPRGKDSSLGTVDLILRGLNSGVLVGRYVRNFGNPVLDFYFAENGLAINVRSANGPSMEPLHLNTGTRPSVFVLTVSPNELRDDQRDAFINLLRDAWGEASRLRNTSRDS